MPDAEYIDANSVLVAYGDLKDTFPVSRSSDGGATFTTYVRADDGLADASAASTAPRFVMDRAGNSWVRFVDEGPELPAIVARRSADGGQTLGPPLRLNRDTPQGSRMNQGAWSYSGGNRGRDVAASSGIAHFAWTGSRATFEEDALYNF